MTRSASLTRTAPIWPRRRTKLFKAGSCRCLRARMACVGGSAVWDGAAVWDDHTVMEGIVWRMRNGAKWRSLPARFGSWCRAAQLHTRWRQAGVWECTFAHLRDAGRPAFEEIFFDGSSIRARYKASRANGGAEPTPWAARAATAAAKRCWHAIRRGAGSQHVRGHSVGASSRNMGPDDPSGTSPHHAGMEPKALANGMMRLDIGRG